MNELKALWQKLLAVPPADDQWQLWAELHTPAVIRKAILATASKNMSLGRTMDQDFMLRFASKVMIVQSQRDVDNAANRERVRNTFGGAQ
ncbi:MAG: hypothetical protein ACM3WP_02110 [Acidobacteriota bacterium]